MINLNKDLGIYILYCVSYFMGPHFIGVGIQSLVRAGAPQRYENLMTIKLLCNVCSHKHAGRNRKMDEKIENIKIKMRGILGLYI